MKQFRIATYILIALHFVRLAIRRARVRHINNRLKPCFDYKPGEINYALKLVIFFRSLKGNILLGLIVHTESLEDGNKLFDYLFGSMGEYWKPYIYLFNDDTDILLHMDVHLTNQWIDIKKSAPLYVPDECSALTQKIENYAASNLSGNIAITVNEICRI